jgi:uncharacterized membrane protein YtjA (UPF0391 family)
MKPNVDVRWLLTLLAVSLVAAAAGFGVGLWLGS